MSRSVVQRVRMPFREFCYGLLCPLLVYSKALVEVGEQRSLLSLGSLESPEVRTFTCQAPTLIRAPSNVSPPE